MRAVDVHTKSDGELTKRYYAELQRRGPAGFVALNLFRAHKCSSRAKVYKGRARKFRDDAYARKEWSMANLCYILGRAGDKLGIRYGWKIDKSVLFGGGGPNGDPSHVLYVELPTGQVSFHAPKRGEGPEYAGEWDGERVSQERILMFCDMVFEGLWPRKDG